MWLYNEKVALINTKVKAQKSRKRASTDAAKSSSESDNKLVTRILDYSKETSTFTRTWILVLFFLLRCLFVYWIYLVYYFLYLRLLIAFWNSWTVKSLCPFLLLIYQNKVINQSGRPKGCQLHCPMFSIAIQKGKKCQHQG